MQSENSNNVLVTGGAGYIGSHVCKMLQRSGFNPVAFDNLSTGWRDAVKYGPLIQGDLLDPVCLAAAFNEYRPIAVMHFAALSLVGQSMSDPGLYWRVNVNGSLNLIEAAIASGCKTFVFSSTCATYGDPDGIVLNENTPQNPINAYGASKLAIEQMLSNFAVSHGLNPVIFRYFNVAGADPEGEVGEQHRPETHLIPLLLDTAAGRRGALTVFGSDYDTPDGTCIRDYVHVTDLADAHVLGLNRALAGSGGVYCLGTGTGFSVREVISQAQRATNCPVPVIEGARRAGDAARLVSGSARAMSELGWKPRNSTLPQMIADAWRWSNTEGYRE